MQKAIEWLIEQFMTNPLPKSKEELLNGDWKHIIEQAKEMEKQQMKGMYIEGSFAMMRKFDGKELVTADEYISETYGSKGSDETNGNNVEKMPNVSSPQSEISDEEILAEAKSQFNEPKFNYAFYVGATWYREQLKSRQ